MKNLILALIVLFTTTNQIISQEKFNIISYEKLDNGEYRTLGHDKSSGEICLTPVHQMEMDNAKNRVKHLKGMVRHTSVPDKCYSPVPDGESGNLKLAIGCIYCNHKRECWSDANQGKGLRAFKYARGLNFLAQVSKEPKVEEVVNW